MRKKTNGFTLIELLATLAILSIVVLIAVSLFSDQIIKAEAEVCNANREMAEKAYERELSVNGDDPSVASFIIFLDKYDKDLCPEHFAISYSGGLVLCAVHSNYQKEDTEAVPFI
ncbi:type II secretion system protein [Virgibacillus kekensis]|uniref:Type II secretion system protein n=1 Tax=Virgibacillus kekensis TaxID=202261 RepID=A0ABV9DH84_9BACI